MIVKNQFSIAKIYQYIKFDFWLILVTTIGSSILLLNDIKFQIPMAVASLMGSAVAIFIAFRNNTSYSRWWEARSQWSSITNFSRILARQVVASTDAVILKGELNPQEIGEFKNIFIRRQALFTKLLIDKLYDKRSSLETDVLTDQEATDLASSVNPPNALLIIQSKYIKAGIEKKMLGAFDNISFDPSISGLQQAQGICERIKETPLLKQYHFFTRIFVLVFVVALSLSLIPAVSKEVNFFIGAVANVIVALFFVIMNKVGEANENPFSGAVTDVPIHTISNKIERELLELVDISLVPEKIKNPEGYQF
jgi:putative membrane protein